MQRLLQSSQGLESRTGRNKCKGQALLPMGLCCAVIVHCNVQGMVWVYPLLSLTSTLLVFE